jgi:hypothetical protein
MLNIFKLALTVAVAAVSISTSFAQDIGRLRDLITLLNALGDFRDASGKTVDGLDRVLQLGPRVSQQLEKLQSDAEKFHAPNYQLPVPKLDGDQFFAADPATRKKALEGWKAFTKAEQQRIESLKVRRDDRKAYLSAIQKKVELVGKIKKVLLEIAEDPRSFGLGDAQYQAAIKAVELDGVENTLSGIESEYKRIVREYDAVIASNESEHNAHLTVLHSLESMLPDANQAAGAVGNDLGRQDAGQQPVNRNAGRPMFPLEPPSSNARGDSSADRHARPSLQSDPGINGHVATPSGAVRPDMSTSSSPNSQRLDGGAETTVPALTPNSPTGPALQPAR